MNNMIVGNLEFYAPIFSQRKLLVEKMLQKDSNFLDVMITYEMHYKKYFLSRTQQNERLQMRLRTHMSNEMALFERRPTKWTSEKLKKEFDNILKLNIN